MSLKGKISLIIVLPIYFGIIIVGFSLALLLYGFGSFLEISGIGEGFEYIGKKIRKESIRLKFRFIRKKEEIE